MGLPEGLHAWFAAGKRLQIRFQVADVLDSHERIHNVAIHSIDDLAETRRQGLASPGPNQLADAPPEPPVITFLHGYPGCSYDYHGVVRHLLAERKVQARLVLLDLLGYGDSDKGVGEARFSIQQHANMVVAVWQRLGITASHLVVHDLSVSIAQELLARQPKGRLPVELGKIFWINGSLFIDLNRPIPLQQSLCGRMGWLYARLLTVDALSAALTDLFSHQHPPSKEVLEYLHQSLVHREGLKVHHKLVKFLKDRTRFKHVWQGALEMAMRRDPDRFMFFWGLQDPKSGAHIVAELHRRYDGRGLRLVTHADLGHWPHLEDPARVAASISDFFTESYAPKYTYVAAGVPDEDRSSHLRRVSLMNGMLMYGPAGGSSLMRRRSICRSSAPAGGVTDSPGATAREDGLAPLTSQPPSGGTLLPRVGSMRKASVSAGGELESIQESVHGSSRFADAAVKADPLPETPTKAATTGAQQQRADSGSPRAVIEATVVTAIDVADGEKERV